jgi:SAM-dependent MidA family methyltransferase
MAENLAKSLVRGAIITTDYGQFGARGEPKATRTFPQEAGSEYRKPGFTDITTDVNFESLQRVAEQAGLTTVFASSQAEFLRANGFPPTEELSQHLSGNALIGAERMIEGFGDTCQTLMVTKGLELAARR